MLSACPHSQHKLTMQPMAPMSARIGAYNEVYEILTHMKTWERAHWWRKAHLFFLDASRVGLAARLEALAALCWDSHDVGAAAGLGRAAASAA